jgi:hypothetical protein
LTEFYALLLRQTTQSSIIVPFWTAFCVLLYSRSRGDFRLMKKYGLLLVALLLISGVLTACSTESADTAKDYLDAVLRGDVEKAQKYACDNYQDQTATWAEDMAGLASANLGVRNIELKYDLGKGNNQKEILVTGSFDMVELNANGKVVADSEKEYEMAASVRDKYDLNNNGDDEERVNTRIVLTMKEEGGDWCVEELAGGYFTPEFSDAGAE